MNTITICGITYVFDIHFDYHNVYDLIYDLETYEPDPEWSYYKFFQFLHNNKLYALYDFSQDIVIISDEWI